MITPATTHPGLITKSSLADWDAIHYAESPDEPAGKSQKFPPLSYHENLKTPTVIPHGAEYQDVPVEQSYLFYRAVEDKSVPTEMIVYPREDHAIKARPHQLDMSRRVLAWFRQYM